MLTRFLFWLSGWLRVRLIYVNEKPYLERYRLLQPIDGGPAVYLHRFLASDPDRGYHSHPWNSVSLVLVNGYLERRWVSGREHVVDIRPWRFNVITPERQHRVELHGSEGWSLFFRAGTAHPWGFISQVPWDGRVPGHNLPAAGPLTEWVFTPAHEDTDHPGFWKTLPRGKDSKREPLHR